MNTLANLTEPPIDYWTLNRTDYNSTFPSQTDLNEPRLSNLSVSNPTIPTITYIHRIIIPIWWCIGFPGNALAFAVWIQPRMRPSSGTYLAALAMTDLIFLVLHVFFEFHNTYGLHNIDLPFICEAFPLVYLSSQYLSVLLVCAFTVERYISICHPFLREKFCTSRRALVVIVSLIFISLGVNAIQVYFWTFKSGADGQRGECGIRQSVIDGGADAVLWIVWSWVSELLIFGLIPLTTLGLNFRVIIEMQRIRSNERILLGARGVPAAQSFKRSKSTSSRHKSGGSGPSATTVMLLAVSFYLILATLPVTFVYVLNLKFPEGNATMSEEEMMTDPVWQSHITYTNVKIIIYDAGISHFALNFYFYLATGKIFRKELKRLARRCRCGYFSKIGRVFGCHGSASVGGNASYSESQRTFSTVIRQRGDHDGGGELLRNSATKTTMLFDDTFDRVMTSSQKQRCVD